MSGIIYGVRLDQDNFLTGTVTTGGQLIGWEFPKQGGKYCWTFRRDVSEFFDAAEVAGALTIKGLTDGSAAAMIRWNAVPMTGKELDLIEKEEGQILNPDALGVGGNKQGQRLAVWRNEAMLSPTVGYQGAQAGVAHMYGYTGNQNELLIQYLQLKLVSTNPSLPGLMAETAIAVGSSSWNGVGEELATL